MGWKDQTNRSDGILFIGETIFVGWCNLEILCLSDRGIKNYAKFCNRTLAREYIIQLFYKGHKLSSRTHLAALEFIRALFRMIGLIIRSTSRKFT